MNRGYIKLWRKSIDGGWLQHPELWVFWCWCLMKATHKPIKSLIGFQEVNLSAGQFIFGRKKCSMELGISERTVRTCLQTLKSTNNVTIKTTSKYSIISIVNWDIYQVEENINDHQNDHQNDQRATSNRPATDHIQTHKEHKAQKKKDSEGKNGIPEWIPKDLWADFKEFRVRIKAPLTDRATKNLILKLESLKKEGQDPVACINEAITRGWRGIFAIQKDTVNKSLMPRN